MSNTIACKINKCANASDLQCEETDMVFRNTLVSTRETRNQRQGTLVLDIDAHRGKAAGGSERNQRFENVAHIPTTSLPSRSIEQH